MNKLPDKLSELLMVAMLDLELCENDPKFVINMDHWYELDSSGICTVCLVGTVMANTFGIKEKGSFSPSCFGPKINEALLGIDQMRCGYGLSGKIFENGEYENGHVMGLESRFNRQEWKEHMVTIIGILQAEGQ